MRKAQYRGRAVPCRRVQGAVGADEAELRFFTPARSAAGSKATMGASRDRPARPPPSRRGLPTAAR